MRIVYFILFVFLFSGCSDLMPKGPKGGDSPEHLLMLTKKYHASNDVKNMLRLYRTDGISEGIIASKERWLKKVFSYDLEDIKLEELSINARQFFNTPVVAAGQTVSYNLYIETQLTATYSGNRQEGFLLGQEKEEGKYYFALQLLQ